MAKKLYDLVAKIGEYTTQSGEKKARWQTVGAVMANDDGGKFVMLSKWFNPAGVPDLSGRGATSESILLSMFEPVPTGNQQQQQFAPRSSAPPQRQAPQQQYSQNDDDSIPF